MSKHHTPLADHIWFQNMKMALASQCGSKNHWVTQGCVHILYKASYMLVHLQSTHKKTTCIIKNWPRPFQVSLYVSMCHFQHSCYVTTASSKSYSHQLYVCRE